MGRDPPVPPVTRCALHLVPVVPARCRHPPVPEAPPEVEDGLFGVPGDEGGSFLVIVWFCLSFMDVLISLMKLLNDVGLWESLPDIGEGMGWMIIPFCSEHVSIFVQS